MIDKKTIIGLVLIFCVFGVWMYITQPSEEERAKMKQKQDSAIAAQIKAEKEAEKAEQMSEQANENVSEELIAMAKGDDSLALAAQKQLSDQFGIFSEAAMNENKSLRVESDLL